MGTVGENIPTLGAAGLPRMGPGSTWGRALKLWEVSVTLWLALPQEVSQTPSTTWDRCPANGRRGTTGTVRMGQNTGLQSSLSTTHQV